MSDFDIDLERGKGLFFFLIRNHGVKFAKSRATNPIKDSDKREYEKLNIARDVIPIAIP